MHKGYSVNCGLLNVFKGKKATTLQSADLLNFREMGEREYINYVH